MKVFSLNADGSALSDEIHSICHVHLWGEVAYNDVISPGERLRGFVIDSR